MYSLVGQSSYNFFAHDLTNHVPELPSDGPLAVQLLRRKFLTASEYAPLAGLSKLAQYDEKGRFATSVNFPFRLHFHPNSTLHFGSPDYYTGEEWEYQVGIQIVPGQHLYDVYAQDNPWSDSTSLIGKFVAKGYGTTSYFADKTLFFQHTRFESDLKYNPSWEKPTKDLLNKQRAMKTPGYHYPDLAWK